MLGVQIQCAQCHDHPFADWKQKEYWAFAGFFAALGAIDRGLYMIPWIPVPPSLWRIVLEGFWVPAAIIAIMRGRMLAASTVDAPPTGDALESYAARLRW